MRIYDIIKPNIPCCLEHPIVGEVYWDIKDGCWGLYFAKGYNGGVKPQPVKAVYRYSDRQGLPCGCKPPNNY